MAGKSPQPSHEPPFQEPVNTDNNQWKEKTKEGGGVGETRTNRCRSQSDCLMRTTSAKTEKTQQRELLKYANTLLEHINANTLKRSWDEPCEPALEQVTADQWKNAR